ncbi:alpha/beta fold hydrolase [Herbaspirillum sp. RV1423]|uniref:alpha/beta fold hydrolase n=1 Tax=Herbaspirillum sp. RV1423 TaxID=1443993 RepID=UPI0004BB80EC|nr:alpha/beta fold hydrolase [Herbaspirillum sp. RV1423]
MKPNPSAVNLHEHSVPWFWPYAAAIEMGEQGAKLFQDNLRFLAESETIATPPKSSWATKNTVRLDLDTMSLRDFSPVDCQATPVLIDAPYAGHSATIADYAKGQSLVETLQANGLQRLMVTDWKAATDSMKQYDIDKYLAEINVVVDDLGGVVHLVGLCQGGWMSAMFAARFPGKVRSLVLAGSPIDTQAGSGPLKKMVHTLPPGFYDEMVNLGKGRMLGRTMLAGWKGMNPGQQYLEKYVDLYQHIEDRSYIKRTETFERWYENPVDLPGTYYLQAIKQLFEENQFCRGKFVGLGKQLLLRDITCPTYLLAGESDDITPHEQVFAAETLLGTPPDRIVKELVPGGHIGLFMGTKTLGEHWPAIARWILATEK